jgi:23S rRNA pseudouridine1911/1915/1917 synthase
MELKVIFENADYLVVNKPAGLMVHGDGRSTEASLVDWLVTNKKVSPEVGESWKDQKGNLLPWPGIVHRLDRDTSGVLVVAKTQEMYEWLKLQFKDRLVKKEYRALVSGSMKEKEGKIDRPIGASASDFRKKSATRGSKGILRDAVTEYVVIRRLHREDLLSMNNLDEATLVALFPKTGRTHQLRVHMKAINHPIIGDALYGGAREQTGQRLMLHAYSLGFSLPDEVSVSYVADTPNDFPRA